ncbi:XRE family transcriptional regulator [Oceanimonas sp. NS1]|uniref:XRE family transcriptional regulator n=1 Tax=Oceanimonas doudoroffii TaxID=84158 RepID=A0A233RIW5_9GAMM|nr:XRE family transcriptional regulator [Oceanimonas doudoroffii]MCT7656590.1 XRE family transcriptional regulator [Oceanimonas sp. NS1]OXY83331.1 XRE family transcriptional regulator [Oceanimonas doudoroffii]
MKELNQHLAATLKRLRAEQGWSLDRCAQATGVSKAMLGQIERGESSPTVATLWKIAGGFNTSLSTFLEPVPEPGPGPLFRQPDRLRQQPAGDGMLVAPLFPFETRFGFEMMELTLLPGYQRQSDPHEPGVIEHVIVRQGELELLLEGHWQALAPGAAVRFNADQPHGYRNRSDSPVVFYNLIHYPA